MNKKLHILVLASWYPMPTKPHIGSFFKEQAHALKLAGAKVGVIAVNQHSIRDFRKPLFNGGHSFVTNDDGVMTYIREVRAWLPGVPYGNAYICRLAFHRLLDQYIREHGMPDVVHAHSVFYAGYAATTYKHSVSTVLTEHNSGFVRGRFGSSWQTSIVHKALGRVEEKIAVSCFFADSLANRYPGFGKWSVIPNIVDERFFKLVNKEVGSNFTFLNVGFLTPVKGQKALISAFSTLLKKVKEVRLIIGGDGPLRTELEEYAAELGIADKITFLGNLTRQQVSECMSSSDAFVLNSVFETFGVVLIEALAAGLPIISTDSGGPSDIIEEHNGILVENHNEDALVNGMLALYERRAEFSKEVIQENCFNKFSGQAISKKLFETYNRIIDKKR